MPSRGVSLKPPLCAFASGVRTARVMTISSGFLVVLASTHQPRYFTLVKLKLKLGFPEEWIGYSHGAHSALSGRNLRNNGLEPLGHVEVVV